MKQSNIKKEFIDKQIFELSKKGGDNKLLNRHKKILDFIIKYSNKDDYILDVGCFDGKILKNLEKLGYKNLYGLDFSEASNKSFLNSSIHFAHYDIEHDEIPFKEKFDAVIYTDVFEHLFSPQTTLFDIRKILSKDGKIIFSVPNAGWFLNGILLSFFPSKLFLSTSFGSWGHSYHFTFFQVKKIAHNLKLRIIKLSGGKMDNYVFNSGIKKILYDLFLIALYPFTLFLPEVFSDHIFGVFENTQTKLKSDARFELDI